MVVNRAIPWSQKDPPLQRDSYVVADPAFPASRESGSITSRFGLSYTRLGSPAWREGKGATNLRAVLRIARKYTVTEFRLCELEICCEPIQYVLSDLVYLLYLSSKAP